MLEWARQRYLFLFRCSICMSSHLNHVSPGPFETRMCVTLLQHYNRQHRKRAKKLFMRTQQYKNSAAEAVVIFVQVYISIKNKIIWESDSKRGTLPWTRLMIKNIVRVHIIQETELFAFIRIIRFYLSSLRVESNYSLFFKYASLFQKNLIEIIIIWHVLYLHFADKSCLSGYPLRCWMNWDTNS